MDKKEFTKRLASRLSFLTRDERQKALDYYDELYLDRLESGEDAAEIIKSFGPIEDIVSRLKNENSAENLVDVSEDRSYKKGKQNFFANCIQTIYNLGRKLFGLFSNKTFLTVYLSLFFITIPLTIGLFAIVFSLVISVLSVVLSIGITIASIYIAFFVCTLAFVISGPIYIGYGILHAFADVNSGLALVGCGIALIALGIMFLLLVKLLNLAAISIMAKKNRKEKISRAFKKMKVKESIIIAAVVLFVGASIFGVGFGRADWNIHELDTATYTNVSVELEDNFTEYKFNLKTRDVKVVKTSGDFRVVAYNYGRSKITATVENGRLTVKESYNFDLETVFNIFSGTNWKLQRVVVYVPTNAVRV